MRNERSISKLWSGRPSIIFLMTEKVEKSPTSSILVLGMTSSRSAELCSKVGSFQFVLQRDFSDFMIKTCAPLFDLLMQMSLIEKVCRHLMYFFQKAFSGETFNCGGIVTSFVGFDLLANKKLTAAS